jgi:hypothetical protein
MLEGDSDQHPIKRKTAGFEGVRRQLPHASRYSDNRRSFTHRMDSNLQRGVGEQTSCLRYHVGQGIGVELSCAPSPGDHEEQGDPRARRFQGQLLPCTLQPFRHVGAGRDQQVVGLLTIGSPAPQGGGAQRLSILAEGAGDEVASDDADGGVRGVQVSAQSLQIAVLHAGVVYPHQVILPHVRREVPASRPQLASRLQLLEVTWREADGLLPPGIRAPGCR